LHWREPFQGSRLVQVFLHYVDRNGPYADQRFDRRITLMRPSPDVDYRVRERSAPQPPLDSPCGHGLR
jgi:hypothetical protein